MYNLPVPPAKLFTPANEMANAWRGNKKTRFNNAVVMRTVEMYGNHRLLHVSLSYKNRIPTYYELSEVKDLFMGDINAVQYFVKKDEHVNIMNHCLHLWAVI